MDAYSRGQGTTGFEHEALIYEGLAEFAGALAPFVADGVAAGEPVLVVADRRKCDLLRAELGGSADAVEFADMRYVGRNPGRLISVWESFVRAHPGARALRGVGEPVGPERRPDELVECEQHESLLNLAFADCPRFHLLCPYDAATLPPAALAGARRTHPLLRDGGHELPSGSYRPPLRTLTWPLPEPAGAAAELEFEGDDLRSVRRFVAGRARALGLRSSRVEDLAFAAGELASNTVRHGPGSGRARVWREDGAVVLEVRDGGRIADPLAGRHQPTPEQTRGRGLWLVNQLCDLVQLRSGPRGTIVRARIAEPQAEPLPTDRPLAGADRPL